MGEAKQCQADRGRRNSHEIQQDASDSGPHQIRHCRIAGDVRDLEHFAISQPTQHWTACHHALTHRLEHGGTDFTGLGGQLKSSPLEPSNCSDIRLTELAHVLEGALQHVLFAAFKQPREFEQFVFVAGTLCERNGQSDAFDGAGRDAGDQANHSGFKLVEGRFASDAQNTERVAVRVTHRCSQERQPRRITGQTVSGKSSRARIVTGVLANQHLAHLERRPDQTLTARHGSGRDDLEQPERGVRLEVLFVLRNQQQFGVRSLQCPHRFDHGALSDILERPGLTQRDQHKLKGFDVLGHDRP